MADGINLSQVSGLNIGLGSGTNSFLVVGTPFGKTVVTGGNGDTSVNVRAIQSPTTFNLGSGDNTIDVGSLAPASGGTLAGIAAALSLSGGTGTSTLNLDDTGDATARTGTLAATSLTGLGMLKGITETGMSAVNLALGSGTDNFTVAGTSAQGATITTVSGNDTFNVQAAAGPLSISTGPGNGTFNVGSLMPTQGGTLSGIVGALTLNPGTGTNTLNVDDSGDTTSRSATLSATALTGMGLGAGINYENIASLSVRMGQGSDTFALSGLVSGHDRGYDRRLVGLQHLLGSDRWRFHRASQAAELCGDHLLHDRWRSERPGHRLADFPGDAGTGQPNGQIDSMVVDGSVTATGVIQAPTIKSLQIDGDLSERSRRRQRVLLEVSM